MSIFSDPKALDLRIKELDVQRDMLDKQWYICRVMKIINSIDFYINDGLFENYKIKKIEISAYADRETPLGLYFELIDERGDIRKNLHKLTDMDSLLTKAFHRLCIPNGQYLGDFFQEGGVTCSFRLELGCTNQIFNELLSKELQLIMQHDSLQDELIKNNEKIKKHKL